MRAGRDSSPVTDQDQTTPPSIAALIRRLPEWGERRALGLRGAFGARWWSYARLFEEACTYAARYQAWGVAPGDHILLWAPNSPEWVAALLGALFRGAVVVPVDEGMSPDLAGRLASRVRATAVLHGPDQEASALSQPAYPLLQPPWPRTGHLDPHPVSPDDPALILFTSGATQTPRGVIITHANLLAQLHNFRRWRLLTRLWPFRLLALSPLSHVQGLMLGALIPLSLGLSVLYSTAVDPESVIRIIRDTGMNLLLAVPGLQHHLVETLRQRPVAPGRESLAERVRDVHFFPLRRHLMFLATHRQLGYSFYVLLVGGAVLPAADERFWYEAGYVLVQGYGLTETTALTSVRVNNPFGSRLGSIGRPLANQEIALSPDGELLVRGGAVSPGYFDEAGALADDGFLPTGDLAEQDDADRLYFRGRKKEVIVTGEGHNVYPTDVEAVLRQLPGVRDAVVIGMADGELTEVHAVLLPEGAADPAAVVAAANAQLEPHQRIRGWTVWSAPDLPRTSLLKVRREAVRQTLSDRSATGVSNAGAKAPETPAATASVPALAAIQATGDRRERLHLLATYLSRTEANGRPAGEAPLTLTEDLGLGSLDVVELATLLERHMGRPLPALPAGPSVTIDEVRALVQEAPRPVRRRLPEAQPAWSGAWPGRWLRHFTQPLLIGLWSRFATRTVVRRSPGALPEDVPCLLAVAPHHHWLDGFVVYAALPRRWRRRVMTVTNRDFSEFFDPAPDTPAALRREVGWAYHLLWPLVFEFAIIPNYGSTRTGLHHLGRFLARGYRPITFPKGLTPPGEPNPRHEPGMAAMALQTGAAIVPVWLQGHERLQLRPRRRPNEVAAWIGDPLYTRPEMSVEEVVTAVEGALSRLAGEAADS